MTIRIGCQVNCWPLGPDFDGGFVTAVREAGEIGFAGVETNWRMLLTWQGREAELDDILIEAGVSLSALFFGAGSAATTAAQQEVEDAVKTAAFLSRLGADRMMVGGGKATNDADTFKRICDHYTELGKQVFLEYGVKACYHLHHGAVASSVEEIDRMMELTDERYWFLCPDTGIMLSEGHDVVDAIDRYAERIPYLHFKDWAGNGKWAMLGQGTVDHVAILRKLSDIAFDGWLISENESGRSDLSPMERQSSDREWLRKQGY